MDSLMSGTESSISLSASSTTTTHSLAVVPNFSLLQSTLMPTNPSNRFTFNFMKFTNPITIEHCMQSLLPLLRTPNIDRCPANQITNNSKSLGEICVSCSKVYKTKKDLQDHIIVYHERKFECERCTRTFVSEKRMKAHELKKHSPFLSNFIKGSNERKLFQCDQCDRSYETFYNFKEHLAKHKGKLFRCTICNKHLSGQSALSRHSKIHEKPHECMMCTSRFSSAYDLDCHFSYYHSSIKRFKCLHCDRVLYNYSGKLRHERLCSLKRAVTDKKIPDLETKVIQKTSEEQNRMASKRGVLMKSNGSMKNVLVQDYSTAEIKESHSSSKIDSENNFIAAPKSLRRKTFHICDIMHDVPGFMQ